ncbi:MAG: hypothetical protein AseanaTS_07600 [Candidatus Pelagadaptatus aseana]|uniref:quinohemoprotein amine dehydrogenase subunit beta n=1 Tax=Candidatus Pelagadaptatus aseana TaxID=3120508 RepID=UPI0039B28212
MKATATIKALAISSLALLTAACSNDESAQTTSDILVGVHRDNHLWVADVDQRKVIQHCDLPGRFGLGTVVLSPDNSIVYVLGDGSETVYGMKWETCELVFQANQSGDGIRAKSFASMAISRDGRELYTIQNRTRLLSDEFQILPPVLAVYDTASGTTAKPIRTFQVPRVNLTMAVDKNGMVYSHGPDLRSFDPNTGEVKTVLEGRAKQVPLETPPDGISAWNNGNHTGEFIKAYTTVKFADESYDMNTAELWWGYQRIDLETGEATDKLFGQYQAPIFSGATRPGDTNLYYGILNQLMKYDVENKELLKIVDLDHAYYQLSFSPKGDRIYLGGTLGDIAIYDPDTLEKLGNIELPDNGDMAMSSFQVFAKVK